jgi:outer membrane protein assembly factor BamB
MPIKPKFSRRQIVQNKSIHIKFKSIVVAVLAIVLISSTFMALGNAAIIKNSELAKPLSPTTNYGDIMQYEWPYVGCDDGQSDFNPGPAPDRHDVLWKVPFTGASGFITVFNGKAFALSGTTLRAFDAFTGALVWNVTLKSSPTGFGTAWVNKLDETYLFVDCSGPEVYKIADGTFVAKYNVTGASSLPGSGQYFAGAYDSALKIKIVLAWDSTANVGKIVAVSLADPQNPKLAWEYVVPEVSEIQGYGDGRFYIGTTQNTLYALNASNGAFLWEARKTGVVQQHGLYYDGNFYQAASTQAVTCWNATTGAVQWEYDASVLGERAYFAYRGAAGYGRYYDVAIPNDPHGWVCCWDAKTGDLLWKQPGYYNIHYAITALADGKVYAQTCDRPSGSVTAGLQMPGYEFTCFDAFTGEQLWKIQGVNFACPTIAYGNLYAAYGGYVYCIGDSTPTSSAATPWSFGYIGNLDQPRVAVGQTGPSDLSKPKWVYATDGKISGSPAIADGKVYIGSDDKNLYCLDAYSGAKIWSFSTGTAVRSSVAVIGGRVYTGSDDGKFYCLNANTGSKIWEANGGGLVENVLMPQELQSRSSPIVVGDKLYAGSMDGKVYCLNIADGSQAWTYTTDGPIGGSPTYANGVIYIASTDTYLYALDASNGALKWKSIPLNLDAGIAAKSIYFCTGTPVVANGVVYIPTGVTGAILEPAEKYRWLTNGVGPGYTAPGGGDGGGLRISAFNANTGDSIWNQTIAGNSGGVWMPTYYNGQIYFPENMRVSSMNASNPNSGPIAPLGYQGQPAGNRTWSQWIGYQILASVAYVDDLCGPKVYIGSDVGSVTCLNATNGAGISAFQTGANVEGSPSLWEGKLYIGGTDGNVYCFDDSPVLSTTLNAESNKGGEMWNNETITVRGQLMGNPDELTWDYSGGIYVPIASEMHPGIPNATVIVSFTKPDQTSMNLTAITDNLGYFTVSYNPTEVGSWGWVAYYEGVVKPRITYNEANCAWNPVSVIAAPGQSTSQPATEQPSQSQAASPQTSATPTSTGSTSYSIPMEYLYVAIVAVVIIVIAVGAFVLTRSRKK